MGDGYEQHYSAEKFWAKLKSAALVAGRDVVEKALLLYYALEKPDLPLWSKTTIYGALGYLISPIDAIPDFTPIIGYADDLGVLALALAAVAIHIDDGVRAKARKKAVEWFGDDGDGGAADADPSPAST